MHSRSANTCVACDQSCDNAPVATRGCVKRRTSVDGVELRGRCREPIGGDDQTSPESSPLRSLACGSDRVMLPRWAAPGAGDANSIHFLRARQAKVEP